ncbi:hypothetical protein [Phaeobacter sp. 22II1-1F12B]|uniref:hypothetical protein n=1 Tax=Phaeobacter sp. 22II1-1F12B TaxID=1317111 RepID=UPI000B521AF2|nr:hypothetical protein [Phaeobacter sp. 22II1-1F12B]OWU82409.1 hypothetical protein ATO1_00275 [Phaeobacter sp. 22II1-1F12B]
MRPIPAPRNPDALPMPEGDSRDWVTHPGAKQAKRYALVPCHVRHAQLNLGKGATLLDAVAQAVEENGADGACVILDGVTLSEMSYVMPDGPADDVHAAWYSETHQADSVTLDHATASVGIKDGAWFLHTHAMWSGDGMGHLLNDLCIVADDITVSAWLIFGARLEVELDPETQFPLFQPKPRPTDAPSNAALLTIRPHEDLRGTLEIVCGEAGLPDAQIHGLGSLIGAGFHDASPMATPLSEVLLLDGCQIRDGVCTGLPLACVDPKGALYQGDLAKGDGAVLVTFEMLVVAD